MTKFTYRFVRFVQKNLPIIGMMDTAIWTSLLLFLQAFLLPSLSVWNFALSAALGMAFSFILMMQVQRVLQKVAS